MAELSSVAPTQGYASFVVANSQGSDTEFDLSLLIPVIGTGAYDKVPIRGPTITTYTVNANTTATGAAGRNMYRLTKEDAEHLTALLSDAYAVYGNKGAEATHRVRSAVHEAYLASAKAATEVSWGTRGSRVSRAGNLNQVLGAGVSVMEERPVSKAGKGGSQVEVVWGGRFDGEIG